MVQSRHVSWISSVADNICVPEPEWISSATTAEVAPRFCFRTLLLSTTSADPCPCPQTRRELRIPLAPHIETHIDPNMQKRKTPDQKNNLVKKNLFKNQFLNSGTSPPTADSADPQQPPQPSNRESDRRFQRPDYLLPDCSWATTKPRSGFGQGDPTSAHNHSRQDMLFFTAS